MICTVLCTWYLQMLMLVTEPSQEMNDELEWMIKLFRLSVLQIIYVLYVRASFSLNSYHQKCDLCNGNGKWRRCTHIHLHTDKQHTKHVVNTLAVFHRQVVSCDNNLRFYCYWMLLSYLFPTRVQGLYIIPLIILFLHCKPLNWVRLRLAGPKLGSTWNGF